MDFCGGSGGGFEKGATIHAGSTVAVSGGCSSLPSGPDPEGTLGPEGWSGPRWPPHPRPQTAPHLGCPFPAAPQPQTRWAAVGPPRGSAAPPRGRAGWAGRCLCGPPAGTAAPPGLQCPGAPGWWPGWGGERGKSQEGWGRGGGAGVWGSRGGRVRVKGCRGLGKEGWAGEGGEWPSSRGLAALQVFH